MIDKLDYQKIFEELKIPLETVTSLSTHSPVFKFQENQCFYVLKKTQNDDSRRKQIFLFSRHLEECEVKTVSPVTRGEKDCLLIDGECWVVYPFVHGGKYNGSMEHIFGAGDLLGKIHKNASNIFTHGFNWNFYNEEYFQDVQNEVAEVCNQYNENCNLDAAKRVVEQTLSMKYQNIKEMEFDLPMVDGIWDFKASNLVYQKKHPVLIDLKNSGCIPRIFDVALALLLFNNKALYSPGRRFNKEEWKTFLRGYNRHITFTEKETSIWLNYLRFIYTDEVLWEIVNLDENQHIRQKELIDNLISFPFENFPIVQ